MRYYEPGFKILDDTGTSLNSSELKKNRVHVYLNHLMINLFTSINIQSSFAQCTIFVFQQIKLIDQVLEVCMQLKNSWG